MGNNTAQILAGKEIFDQYTENYKDHELLKIFLITNISDITKTYNFISDLLRNMAGDPERKASLKRAQILLEKLALKRIDLTATIYGIDDIIISEEDIEKDEPEEDDNKVVAMYPTIDEVFERIKKIMLEHKDNYTAAKAKAFEYATETFGSGKVKNKEGESKTVHWTDDQIGRYIFSQLEANNIKEQVVKTEKKVENEGEKIGMNTITQIITDRANHKDSVEKIKEILHNVLIGKTINTKNKEAKIDDYVIKDEKVWEDFYSRILETLVKHEVEKASNLPVTAEEKAKAIDNAIKAEVVPFLKSEEEKSTDKSPFVAVAKMLRQIYNRFNLAMELRDSYFKAKELGDKYAPNLSKHVVEKNRNERKLKDKTEETAKSSTEKKEEKVEVFDKSHNISETNKDLLDEVMGYTTLEQIVVKAKELVKQGKWQDALSMAILLISGENIKETEKSENPIKWDEKQIISWFSTLFPEDKKEEKKEGDEPKNLENSGGSKETKIGPAVVTGALDAAGKTTKLLVQPELWKDKYGFKTFEVPTDNLEGSMLLQVVDASLEQEKDLLVSEINLTAFFDRLKDKLLKSPNDYNNVKNTIIKELQPIYNLSNAEVNRMMGAMRRETEELRKELKNKGQWPPAEEEQISNPKTEEKEIPGAIEETVQPEKKEEKETTPQQTETESTESENEESSGQEDITSTEKDTTEDKSVDYTGFEDILKAKTALEFNKRIYDKIQEYKSVEEGKKAVFKVFNAARKERRRKGCQVRNFAGMTEADVLNKINKIIEKGNEKSKEEI